MTDECYEPQHFKKLLIRFAGKLSDNFIKTFSERDLEDFSDLSMGYEAKTNDKTYHLVFEFKEVKDE